MNVGALVAPQARETGRSWQVVPGQSASLVGTLAGALRLLNFNDGEGRLYEADCLVQ